MKKISTVLIIGVLMLFVSLTAYAAESGAVITLNEGTQENSGAVVVDWGADFSSAASPATDVPAVNGGTQDYVPVQPYVPVEAAQPSYSSAPATSGYGYAVGLYPQNVETVTENGVMLVKKTYEVSPDVNPETLVQPFEQDGFRFSKREILRRDLPGETLSRLAFKTAETDTDSDDAALIARQFPGVIEHQEDGYSGQLQLDASSLVTVAAEFERYSYPYTKTREVSGLARNDPSYLDKEWNGMTLTNVSFKQDAGGLYTATATYKGIASGKRATGYVSSVKYFGTLTKEVPGNVLYTIVYEGEPIAPIEPEHTVPPNNTVADDVDNTVNAEASGDDSPEPSAVPADDKGYINLLPIVSSVIFLIGAVFVPVYTTKQQRKERKQNREAIEEIKRFIRGED